MFANEKSSLLEPGKQGKLVIGTNESKPAARPEMSAAEKKAIQQQFNTASNLRETFFEPNSTIIDIITLPSGGKVSIMVPSGPYSEHSVMVIATGPETLNYSDEQYIPTQSIYDLPEDVQTAFWQAIRVCQQFYKAEFPNARIFSTENCNLLRTGESLVPGGKEYVTSKTIANPHSQIVMIEDDHIEPIDEPFTGDLKNNLTREQKLFSNERLNQYFLERLQTEYLRITGTNLKDLEVRKFAPYGYTFFADSLSMPEIMRNHHLAYTKISQELYGELSERHKENIIPQPSYRLFTSTHGAENQVVVSPQTLPYGPIEAAFVKLDRKAENPRRTPLEVVEQYRKLLIAMFEAQKILA